MPKIEVYKGNRIMIPVSQAKKSKAYQCPWTYKLYSTKRDYVKHLKKLREERMHRRAREIIRNRVKADLWNQPTFDDIINWISTHPEFMFDRMMEQQWSDRKTHFEKYRETFTFEITHLSVSWCDHCSNTHSCPHDGVRNWGGRETLTDGTPAPHGYPGWSGHIEFKLNCGMSEGSRVLEKLRIHTGTGGGKSNNQYGYGVTFFADDWPELYKNHKMQHAEDIICDNQPRLKYTYGEADYFKW